MRNDINIRDSSNQLTERLGKQYKHLTRMMPVLPVRVVWKQSSSCLGKVVQYLIVLPLKFHPKEKVF